MARHLTRAGADGGAKLLTSSLQWSKEWAEKAGNKMYFPGENFTNIYPSQVNSQWHKRKQLRPFLLWQTNECIGITYKSMCEGLLTGAWMKGCLQKHELLISSCIVKKAHPKLDDWSKPYPWSFLNNFQAGSPVSCLPLFGSYITLKRSLLSFSSVSFLGFMSLSHSGRKCFNSAFRGCAPSDVLPLCPTSEVPNTTEPMKLCIHQWMDP